MTARELTWGGGILLLGVFVGAMFMRAKGGQPATAERPDAAPSPEPSTPAPEEPELEPDARAAPEPPPPTPTATVAAVVEAGAPDVQSSLPGHLSIRPAAAKHRCVDIRSHTHELQLFKCHGKENQRWTFSDESDGTSRLVSDIGECVVLDALGSPLRTKPCGPDAMKVRRRPDGRLVDLVTERCLTARGIENRTPITLEPCDTSDMQQEWYLK